MHKHWISGLLATSALATVGSALAAAAGPSLDADDIGGTVAGARGPEAGVWVIAETGELATNFVKIVVTDDRGRYVLPDLPKAKYKVWVRGYGLVDSQAVEGVPGRPLDLKAVTAPDARAAAEIYPANYWYALLRPPAAHEFPGTGPQGNGISPGMTNRQEWLAHMKEQCLFCHQMGTKATRELVDTGNSIEAWDQRVRKARSADDATLGRRAESLTATMNNNMSRFGRSRGLTMYADWTDRIAKGEVPPAPPRPQGVERNIVLTMWDWGAGHFVHDEITSDKRNPTVNAGGKAYGTDDFYGHLVVLDPASHQPTEIPIPGSTPARPHNEASGIHNPMIDQKGRVWLTRVNSVGVKAGADGPMAAFCGDAAQSPFAKAFPAASPNRQEIGVYDPAKGKIELIPVCFGTHHLQFAFDADNTLYTSGDTNLMGWINTRVYDETKDAAKAVGWCPMVLDTNGDGKSTLDRTQLNEPGKESDPKKDTRISGFLYAMGVSPKDNSVWHTKFGPSVPSGIVRFEPGSNPPETCKTEYYEPPKLGDGSYAAFNGRGVDLDSKGIAWVAFGSGQIGRFDRTRCKVLNGAAATGQQCPEGWTFYDSPGPKVTGYDIGTADWHYLAWVDQHNIFGLGKDVPMVPGTNSDSIVALLPDTGKHVVVRVPYPLGFYSRGLDGRVDDAKTGWKGRGLWANYGVAPLWHTETGDGVPGKLVKFQLRPDPLAH